MGSSKDFIPNNLDHLKYGLGRKGLIGQHEQDIGGCVVSA